VLLDKLQALGVDRRHLPESINDFFGTFGSERQNVIKACDFVRNSPLIGPKIPVHGLLIDVESGKLDWVVNGYDTLQAHALPQMPKMEFASLGTAGSFKDFEMGEMKFPEMKIGDAALPANTVPPPVITPLSIVPPAPPLATLPPKKTSGKLPAPPPIKPRPTFPGKY
jgi:carbonic anhydrase